MARYYKKRSRRQYRPKHYINQYIRVPEVRLVDEEGQNAGVVPTKEALSRAREKELDLVLISEKANPPVAKILKYSKFLYDERKKQASSKTKSTKSETKEVIFGPNIGDGDLQMRIDRTKEFIAEGHRVKIIVRLRGRQRAHPEVGMEKIDRAVAELSSVARVEEKPKLKGYLITATFIKKS